MPNEDLYDGSEEEPKAVNAKVMSVVECTPARADNPETGEPVARLVFSHRGKPQPPIMLTVPNIRSLAAKLISVLAYFDDSSAKRMESFFLTGTQWPTEMILKTPKSRRIPPSRSRKAPVYPLGETEAWQMIQMVRHAADHDTFMRFIGAVIAKPRSTKKSPESKHIQRKKPRRRGD